MDSIITMFVLVYGVIIGSFINAFVWRFRQTHDDDGNLLKLPKPKARKMSIVKGRSMCPECAHQLSFKDLVPVISWLTLKGKCRYCQKPIGAQYPLVELTTAVLFGISYLSWPYATDSLGIIALISWLVLVAGFVTLAVYDVKWFLLPDKIVFTLLPTAIILAGALATGSDDLGVAIRDAIIGATILSGLFASILLISKGRWIGGGDVKLGLVLGLIAGGALESVLILFLASIFGLVVSMPVLLKKGFNMKLKIPFGPMLLAATYVVFLFGERMLDWYMGALVL